MFSKNGLIARITIEDDGTVMIRHQGNFQAIGNIKDSDTNEVTIRGKIARLGYKDAVFIEQYEHTTEDKINAKYDAELAALEQPQEKSLSADAREALNMKPLNIEPNKIQPFTIYTQEAAKKYQETIGKPLTFEKSLGLLVNKMGFDKVEQSFNYLKEAWEKETTLPQPKSFDKIYNDFFGYDENIYNLADNAINSVLNKSENKIQPKEVTKEVLQKEVEKENSKISEDNSPNVLNENGVKAFKYLGDKIAKPDNKLAYLSVPYDEIEDVLTGDVSFVDKKDAQLNINGSVDLNMVLDPDLLVPGKQLTVEIAENWENIPVTFYKRNSQGKLDSRTTTLAKEGIEIGSDEWIKRVPMNIFCRW